jgi:hypothetical protein
VASGQDKEIALGHVFGHCSKHAEAAECFTGLFIEPLFDYIDEQIDDRRTVLGLLLKYKHNVEWFRRDDLRTRFPHSGESAALPVLPRGSAAHVGEAGRKMGYGALR